MEGNFTLADAMESVEEYLAEKYTEAEEQLAQEEALDKSNTVKGAIKDTIANAKMTNNYKQNEIVAAKGEDTLNNEHERQNKEITESTVSEMRLKVFEAAEAGMIGEEEKAMMLEMLNLDNYE